MNYEVVSLKLHRTRGDIAAVKRDAKLKYGSKDNWPADVRWRYDYLKRCASELGEMVGEDVAA